MDTELYLTILEQPRKENKAEQGQGLAVAYSNQGFRDYLQNTIRNNLLGLMIVSKEDIDKQKGRIEVLSELLKICKQSFTDFEKLKVNKLE